MQISIHALREEGDASAAVDNHNGAEFLSTSSARRATQEHLSPGKPCRISIHALREEGDHGVDGAGRQRNISIHALREEGDLPRRKAS